MSSQLQQEIADWFDNPITDKFYQVVNKALNDLHEDKRNAFAPENPQATQERHAWLLGAEWALGQLNDMREQKEFFVDE